MPPKRKKHVNRAYSGTKEVLFKEDECHWYALALKALGDRRFRLLCDDGVERIGKLRGNMRRRQFVSAGTLVLAFADDGTEGDESMNGAGAFLD
jgi:translation initiation factor 1A